MIDLSGAPRIPSGNVADPGPIVNDALNVGKWVEVYGEDPTNTDPLVYAHLPGRWGGFAIAAGSEALTNDSTNYVVVQRATGVLSVATTTTNWNNTDDYARVARIVLASGARTDDEDFRAGPNGVHGGGGGGGGGSSAAPLITEASANRDFAAADAGAYVRFTATGAKTASFDVADGFAAPQEYHIANRAASGNLTLTPTGITLNAPKGGTLVLEPGDTVTVKFVDTDEADVFGSTEAA